MPNKYSILNEECEPVATLRPDVPDTLAKFIASMLHKDRTVRIGSMTRAVAELSTLQSKEAVVPGTLQLLKRLKRPLFAVPIVILLLVLCLLALEGGCGQKSRKPALEVSYIANEGFIIAMGGTTILIDALPGWKYYVNPSDTLAARIMNGIPPFDRVDYVLVTHDHPDHFNVEMMSRFLPNHPAAQLIASAETCSKLISCAFILPEFQPICFGIAHIA